MEEHYKPLIRTPDGKLVSVWAGLLTGEMLEYKEGEITYTPAGGVGIWVSKSAEEAKYQGGANSGERIRELGGSVVIHKVTPLGKRCGSFNTKEGYPSIFSSDQRFPAVLVGEEAHQEAKVEERDVTEECELKWQHRGGIGSLIDIKHEGHHVACIGLLAEKEYLPFLSNYRLERTHKCLDGSGWDFRVFYSPTPYPTAKGD